ncbi:MAG: hypothetical protein HOM68_06100 [Gemmatimonadetes bacterium]|jgi:hypothetical protein|nr:hypothetical protein [Gemmatimonadota bacterium]MBT5056096.1 hypothetical protein [Gemmatimonadota bacterium]MBT5142768.1 hypothetical protein [Gemmatimonadota bacterium]MBT5587744.1 hypothetical protein [Gemmatimonadota bacterium]MBT5960666.1 hypothetical protein [Gemmatimonadota bacterium]
MICRIALLVIAASALTQCSWIHAGAASTEKAQAAATGARLQQSDGGQLVLRAIEAHGGLEAWYRAATSAYSWEYSNAGMDFRFKSYLVADNRTRQIYHELLEFGTPANPQPASGRFAWDGEQAWISPAALEQPNARFWAGTGYYFESIPFILADPGLHYETLPDEELDGVAHHMVRVSYDEGVGDSPGDLYTLYVHPQTGRVSAIRYTVSFGRTKAEAMAQQVRETLLHYEEYVTVDGLTVPTHFRGFHFVDGAPADFKNEAWASDISFSETFDPAKLVMPADGRVQPMGW